MCFTPSTVSAQSGEWGAPGYTVTGDFNGDGVTDIATISNGRILTRYSTNSPPAISLKEDTFPNMSLNNGACFRNNRPPEFPRGWVMSGDWFNNGLSDIIIINGSSNLNVSNT